MGLRWVLVELWWIVVGCGGLCWILFLFVFFVVSVGDGEGSRSGGDGGGDGEAGSSVCVRVVFGGGIFESGDVGDALGVSGGGSGVRELVVLVIGWLYGLAVSVWCSGASGSGGSGGAWTTKGLRRHVR